MKTLTLEEYHAQLKAQKVAHEDFAMKCPMCGTIQSARDLIAAGAGKTFEEVEKYLGFSCVGRFTHSKPPDVGRKPQPGLTGCNWSLGGLLCLHNLAVVTPDGEKHPRFEVATPEEALAHIKQPTP